CVGLGSGVGVAGGGGIGRRRLVRSVGGLDGCLEGLTVDGGALVVDDLDLLDEPIECLSLLYVRAYRRELSTALELLAHQLEGLADLLGHLGELGGEV